MRANSAITEIEKTILEFFALNNGFTVMPLKS